MMVPPMKPLSLSLQFARFENLAQHRQALPRQQLTRWIRAALQGPACITVRVVDTAEGRTLNRDYRHKDDATNVLTFDYLSDDVHEPMITADIVLCAPVVAAEALAQNKSLQAHYAHLIVHGVLHAQGFDHILDTDACVMEQQESCIMVGLGFEDPWKPDACDG